jgi:hypothetical protein
MVQRLASFVADRETGNSSELAASGLEGVLEVAIFSSSKRWSAGDPGPASSSDRTHGCRGSPLGSKAHSGRIGKVRISGFRQDHGQIYASMSQPGSPGRLGLRLFLRPDCAVQDASRLLRHPTRKQRDPPRRSDAASESWLGRTENRGMLRLGSSATAIFDS